MNVTTELPEVIEKFQVNVNEIMSDINLDEQLITSKLPGLKTHRRVLMFWFHVYYMNLHR